MYWIFEKIKETFFAERERWLLWVPVLFGAGIGIYFLLPREPSLWFSAIVVEAIIILAFIWRMNRLRLMLLAVIAIIFAGFINIQLKAYYIGHQAKFDKTQTLYLNGKISNIDKNYRGQMRITLVNPQDFEQNRYNGKYKITLRSKENEITQGECVELVARLMPLPAPSMVGGYQFNRKFFFEGITANGYALSSIGKVDCEKKEFDFMSQYINKTRQNIVNRINMILPPDEAGITAAIIAGERGGIDRKITKNYRDSGLAHFLSISGLHLTMIVGLMFFFIRSLIALIPPLALRYDSKKIAAVSAMLLSLFYLLISGAEIPTQRAFIMTFIVLLGVLLGRRAISMQTICWAGLFILIVSPQALVGASFQMSFAAVVMLIAFYEHFAGALHRFLNGGCHKNIGIISRLWRVVFAYMVGIVVSDFVASLSTLPFAIYHFNRISIYTTIGNFCAAPIIGLVIMPFMLIALLLMPIGADVWAIKIVGYGVGLVNKITADVASLPQAGYQVLSMPCWGLILIVCGGLWLAIWNMPWRKWGWIGIIVGALSIFMVQTPKAMISADGLLFAVQDTNGKLVFMPRRGKVFNKQLWLEKTANSQLGRENKRRINEIWRGEKEYPEWIDLKCNKTFCIYAGKFKYYKDGRLEINNKPFDTQYSGGASFFADGEIKTVRDYAGQRIWNLF